MWELLYTFCRTQGKGGWRHRRGRIQRVSQNEGQLPSVSALIAGSISLMNPVCHTLSKDLLNAVYL
jgi:hypothetical protein